MGQHGTVTTSSGAQHRLGDNIVWGTRWLRGAGGANGKHALSVTPRPRLRRLRRRRRQRRHALAQRVAGADGQRVSLRELRVEDAPALFAALSSEQVSRFISPPPTTVEGFERFIAWAHRQREAGQYVVLRDRAARVGPSIGIFQVRSLEPDFGTAEWGFALASGVLGRGHVHRRREAGHGFRVRCASVRIGWRRARR